MCWLACQMRGGTEGRGLEAERYSHTISYPFNFSFFYSNLLEHSTEGLAWRPGLINCESSEIGLENGAWRLALGRLRWRTGT